MEVMQPEFKNYSKEWWHYVLKDEPLPRTSYDFDIVASSDHQDEIVVFLADPTILAQLDSKTNGPFSLVTLFKILSAQNQLAVPQIDTQSKSTADVLVRFHETYGNFVSVFSSDLDRIVKELGVDWEKDITQTYNSAAAKTEAGKQLRLNGNVMRVFNQKWLSSIEGQFILAGVVNRIDRKDFDPGSCGEVRFIYRLGYEVSMNDQIYASRMPFTVNMVFRYPNDGNNCSEVAALWKKENTTTLQKLMDGPLDFSKLQFKQMEINAQIARFPSDLENDENRNFAGQAIYWMRIFALSQGKMQPIKLENTPDVIGILNDENRKNKLLAFLSENLSQIDKGVFRLPDEFLSDLALTYSTLGSARIANKPFNVLISSKEVDQIFSQNTQKNNFQFIASGNSLLERLNTSTCMGCHQSSSTAGFHFLGQDRIDFSENADAIRKALDGNRLNLAFSPHFSAEIPRRIAYLQQLIKGEAPEIFRPHPSAPWEQASAVNMPCPTSDLGLASSSNWGCGEKLSCSLLVVNSSLAGEMGQCVPASANLYAGLSCRTNEIEDSTQNINKELITYNLASYRDKVIKDEQFYGLSEGKITSTELNCRPTRIGVPLGRTTRSCTADEMSLQKVKIGNAPEEICGMVGGKGFEEMAKGYFDSAKFASGVGRGMLNACSADQNCREDYICQAMPDFLSNARFGVKVDILSNIQSNNIGFCTPTYFVYQLRLDGHPNPR